VTEFFLWISDLLCMLEVWSSHSWCGQFGRTN
jgi:hypothetical protein